jgi:carboxylesterase type B
MAAMMSAYWFNFAARGDPNGQGLPPWPEFAPGAAEYGLNLGPMTPGAVLDTERLTIFDALYRKNYGE